MFKIKDKPQQFFEIPFRPVYELYMATGWLLTAGFTAWQAAYGRMPPAAFWITTVFCIAMVTARGIPAYQLTRERRRLANAYELRKISFADMRAITKDSLEQYWLGWGFQWNNKAVQATHEMLRRGPENIVGEKHARSAGWIHGLDAEHAIHEPIKNLGGHTLIIGTTGSGKTRLLDLLISQAVARDEAVIVLDPKGDKDLKEHTERACELTGHPEKFVYFHPAYPEKSARIDPLKNWNRPTEVASRVAALIPSEGGGDPFSAFGWKALNDIVLGLLLIEKRPNLVKLRRYVENGTKHLLISAMQMYFDRKGQTDPKLADWRVRLQPYLRSGSKKQDPDEEVHGYISFYRQEGIHLAPDLAIEGLVSSFEHNRDHFQKMVASLIPILSMLTSGPLREMLSPDNEADGDKLSDFHQTTDMAKIINSGKVAYIGLDSLSDSTVGSAIGSIMLADLTAVAGDRYNYGVNNRPVNIFVDEMAELINKPFIQLANKSRGAAFRLTVATQTIGDISSRLGSKDEARMLLGNMNNLIALRVIDDDTQKYIAESLPPATIKRMELSYNSSIRSRSAIAFDGSYGEKVKEVPGDMFPAPLLGVLPDFHYIAKLSGGHIIKGRIPFII